MWCFRLQYHLSAKAAIRRQATCHHIEHSIWVGIPCANILSKHRFVAYSSGAYCKPLCDPKKIQLINQSGKWNFRLMSWAWGNVCQCRRFDSPGRCLIQAVSVSKSHQISVKRKLRSQPSCFTFYLALFWKSLESCVSQTSTMRYLSHHPQCDA